MALALSARMLACTHELPQCMPSAVALVGQCAVTVDQIGFTWGKVRHTVRRTGMRSCRQGPVRF